MFNCIKKQLSKNNSNNHNNIIYNIPETHHQIQQTITKLNNDILLINKSLTEKQHTIESLHKSNIECKHRIDEMESKNNIIANTIRLLVIFCIVKL